MENDESQFHEPLTGAPRVSPEVIKAFSHKSGNFERAFRKLKQENPELAHEMMRFSEARTQDLHAKHAMMHGALHMYEMLAGHQETEWFARVYGNETVSSDDAAFEDPQPLT